MQDPKQLLLNLRTANLSVTKDDNATRANVLVTSQWYSDQVMSACDALVTVGTLTDPIAPAGLGFVGGEDHTYMADVNFWCINKFDSAGTRVITDTRNCVRWKSRLRSLWRQSSSEIEEIQRNQNNHRQPSAAFSQVKFTQSF